MQNPSIEDEISNIRSKLLKAVSQRPDVAKCFALELLAELSGQIRLVCPHCKRTLDLNEAFVW